MMSTHIDLATELGESFVLAPAGIPLEFLAQATIDDRRLHPRHLLPRDDELLLGMVSTGYVACGAHAGDPIVMGRTVRLLVDRGVAVGAHPSYPDIFGFGQLSLDLEDREMEDILLVQIASLAAIAEAAGTRVSCVKCHGALSFDVSYDERTAQVTARTLYKFDPDITLVCMAGSPGARVARDCGLRVTEEAYIDRGYGPSGRIVGREHPSALVNSPEQARDQFLHILRQGNVRTVDGEWIPLRADSFCLHSDTPNAEAIAAAILQAIADEHLSVRPAA
jgi:UPF0271 protein